MLQVPQALGVALLQEARLQAEVDRLQLELMTAQADQDRLLSSQHASTSGGGPVGWHPPPLPPPRQSQVQNTPLPPLTPS